jgi:hypothetical protein
VLLRWIKFLLWAQNYDPWGKFWVSGRVKIRKDRMTRAVGLFEFDASPKTAALRERCDKADCRHEGSKLFSVFRLLPPKGFPIKLRNFYTKPGICCLSYSEELFAHYTQCVDKIDQHCLLLRICDPRIFLSVWCVCVPFGVLVQIQDSFPAMIFENTCFLRWSFRTFCGSILLCVY